MAHDDEAHVEDEQSLPKSYRKWSQRISRARKLRGEWEDKYQVRKLEEYFYGDQNEGADGQTIYNYFQATLLDILPYLFLRSPKFLVRPKRTQGSAAIDRMTAMAEGLLTDIGEEDQHLENAVRLALLQAFFRMGVLKSVYDPRLEPNPQAGEPIVMRDEAGNPIIDPNTVTQKFDANGQAVEDMSQAQAQPMLDPETGEPLIEPDENLTDEIFHWEYVDARRILLPNEGADPTKWSWIGEEITVTLEEAQNDPRFGEGAKALKSNVKVEDIGEMEETGSSQFMSSDEDDMDKDPDEKLFRYVECYDIKKNMWAAWADGQIKQELLFEEPTPEGIEDHPYALLRFVPIIAPKSCPWPLPYTHSWKDPQKEYNISRQQVVEGAKRASRKLLHEEDTFENEDDAFRCLQSPADMEAVKVTDLNNPPQVLTVPDVSQTIHANISISAGDWMRVTRRSGARLGRMEKGTATEANLVEQSSNVGDIDLQHHVIMWMGRAGVKMLQLLQANMTLDVMTRIRGLTDEEVLRHAKELYNLEPDQIHLFPGVKKAMTERLGKDEWVSVTREELLFQAGVTVDPGSSRPRNLENERQQWMEFLTLIGQFPQLALSHEVMKETAAKYDFLNERAVDELVALAQQMIQVQQQTAGHGGEENGADAVNAQLSDLNGGGGV